jgi:hypothetical protein
VKSNHHIDPRDMFGRFRPIFWQTPRRYGEVVEAAWRPFPASSGDFPSTNGCIRDRGKATIVAAKGPPDHVVAAPRH